MNDLITAIRLSPMAAIVTDASAPDNPIIAVNRGFEQLTGYGEAELLGRNCRILAGPETPFEQSARLAHAVATGAPTLVELVNYRKDGTKFLNAVMIAPVFDDHGRLAHFIGTQMAIDQDGADDVRCRANARIATLTQRQQAVLRLMAHGLRNRQIGDRLRVTEKTVKMHRLALLKRLGGVTAAKAIRLAVEGGL